jgi:hypothetical protein
MNELNTSTKHTAIWRPNGDLDSGAAYTSEKRPSAGRSTTVLPGAICTADIPDEARLDRGQRIEDRVCAWQQDLGGMRMHG